MLALVADALAWPLLLLDVEGRLLVANLAARQLLDTGMLLRLSTQSLVAPSDPRDATAFRQALQAAAAGDSPQLLQWHGAPHMKTIGACLTRLADEAAGAPGGPTLLLALGADGARNNDLRAFAAHHGLSPAETRVLKRLALGESSVRAALALGVGAATVRSHTLSLRRKTGHASVAALLRTLAQMPPLVMSGGSPAVLDEGE
jgi:DNA-binding CsgD family transcriptional regulator